MEKIFNFNLDNVLPIHKNLTEEEKSFSDFYISQFGLETDERVDVPFLILCPFSFQNLITDIIRDYNLYLSDLVDMEVE